MVVSVVAVIALCALGFLFFTQVSSCGNTIVEPPPPPPEPKATLNEYSWQELKIISGEISDAGDKDAALDIAAKYNLLTPERTIDASQTKDVTLSNGVSAHVRIIGVYHDAKTGEKKKAGLTFQFVEAVAAGAMNASKSNKGGWEASELRAWLQADFVALLPKDLSAQIAAVDKKTNNTGEADSTSCISETSDTVWLLSFSEVAGQRSEKDFSKDPYTLSLIYNAEGSQYQLYRELGIVYNKPNDSAIFTYIATYPNSGDTITGQPCGWWQRSPKSSSSTNFACTTEDGRPGRTLNANVVMGIVPAFCL